MLNLTALMDILSNLLFFLLASYTVQSLEAGQKGVQLPTSTSQAKAVENLVVTVSRSQILVAQVPVAGVEGDRITGTTVESDDKVVALYDKLRNVRLARAAAGRDDGADAETILFLADRSTDGAIITKVLKTAGMAGFVNVRFGVVGK